MSLQWKDDFFKLMAGRIHGKYLINCGKTYFIKIKRLNNKLKNYKKKTFHLLFKWSHYKKSYQCERLD